MNRLTTIALASALSVLVMPAVSAQATPTMPSNETLFTIEHAAGGRLGTMDANGVVTPIGNGDIEVYDVRDADYDWVHGIAYVLADGDAQDNTCDVWTIDLTTGEYSLAWSVYDHNHNPMTFCDSLMVGDGDASQIWISGEDYDLLPDTGVYDRVDGTFQYETNDNDMWQSMDNYSADNVTTYFYNEDSAGGRFYNALDANAVWTTGYDNMQSISYTEDGQLWFTDWNEGVTVGQIDATTGEADVLTPNLRYANGDQWGTDAIFWGPAPDATANDNLASTGFDGTGLAVTGVALAATGAFVIRRRARR